MFLRSKHLAILEARQYSSAISLMKRLLLVFSLGLLMGCASHNSQQMVVLDYDDFGPQVIANEVLGMAWWQWDNHGDSRHRNYDVNVIVYRYVALKDVASQYPVNVEKKIDFRYLHYQKALDYLDEKIAENAIEAVTETLRKTREKIIKELGR